jgi:hypothetical protein
MNDCSGHQCDFFASGSGSKGMVHKVISHDEKLYAPQSGPETKLKLPREGPMQRSLEEQISRDELRPVADVSGQVADGAAYSSRGGMMFQ